MMGEGNGRWRQIPLTLLPKRIRFDEFACQKLQHSVRPWRTPSSVISYLAVDVVMEIVEIHRSLWWRAHEKEVVVLQLRLSEIWLAGASMNLWQSPQDILEHVQHETEERPLTVVELDAIFATTLQCLRTVGANPREVGLQKSPTHHKQNLILVVDVWIRQKLR